jgi:hypothetical protein
METLIWWSKLTSNGPTFHFWCYCRPPLQLQAAFVTIRPRRWDFLSAGAYINGNSSADWLTTIEACIHEGNDILVSNIHVAIYVGIIASPRPLAHRYDRAETCLESEDGQFQHFLLAVSSETLFCPFIRWVGLFDLISVYPHNASIWKIIGLCSSKCSFTP